MKLFSQILLWLFAVALCRADPEAFLESYCFECHDDSVQKGDRRFDELDFPVKELSGLIEIQEIIDQLNLGEMPPKKAEQPSDEERAATIAAMTEMVAAAAEKLRGTRARTVLRRLNQREYFNTVEDLFGRRCDLLDPTASFPSDQEVKHLDNIGDTLVMSSYLLDRYMDAADLVVEKALGLNEKPKKQSWRFKGNFEQGQELSVHKKVFNNRYLCVYEVPNTTRYEGSYGYIHEFQKGVPVEGRYEIRVLAHARNRKNPYDPSIFRMDFDEPFRLGVVPGDKDTGKLHHPQPIEPKLAEVTVRDGEPEWYSMTVWLEKGQTPRFIFPNGMQSCRNAFGTIARRYQDHWPEKERGKKGIVDARRIVLTHGRMPHIRIHEIEIEGPSYDQWPPESQRLVFGENGFQSGNSREVLVRFADRAFRRPASKPEIDRLMQIVAARRDLGHSSRESVKDALKAVLCSPAFLYLAEPGQDADQSNPVLGPHDLASRLSYFLWATMPDAELRKLADSGGILKERVLLSQLERLLDDSRSGEFEKGFTGSWLNLRSLGDMPPDREEFAVYYAKDLEKAMKREVQLYLRHLIREDRPIAEFLDSNYTFANRPLARLYEIPQPFDPEKAHLFRKVDFTRSKKGRASRHGSRSYGHGKWNRHLAHQTRGVASREYPRYAAAAAAGRRSGHRAGHSGRHHDPGSTREAPGTFDLPQLPSEDRPPGVCSREI